MDKGKLTSLVRLKTGWDKEVSDQAVEIVLRSIRELLHHGTRLTIHGFGTFAVRMSKPRRARNINTGEAVAVPPRKQVKFRMSQEFLE
ncbi:MAG: HU family DNA-binding protein [Elusimicrobia bacterium]|nr:HU family DNA-binding protein [Elusimicrobiota bacterium]